MLRVGLTGGIACGKSRVLRRLAAAGFSTIDLDRVAHDVMAPGASAYAGVVAAFGTGILGPDGAIDRKALGTIVFADPHARAVLNAVVHPRVRAVETQRAAALGDAEGLVFVTDAALLVESGTHLRFDRLVVAHCPPAEQVRRIMHRDGLGASAARARVAAQMPVEWKREFAHHAIDTSGSFASTDAQIDDTIEALRALARRTRDPVVVNAERAAQALEAAPVGPGGLSALAVAERIALDACPDMESLAHMMAPPLAGPWYDAASAVAEEAGAAGPILAGTLWALARSGTDAPYLCAVSASMARLGARNRAAVGRGCALGLLFAHVATTATLPEKSGPFVDAWLKDAADWGTAPPNAWLADRLSPRADRGAPDATDGVVEALVGQRLREASGPSRAIAERLLQR